MKSLSKIKDTLRKVGLALYFFFVFFLITLPNTSTAKEKPILTIDSGGHMALINDVIFTPDSKFLISVSNDKTIRVWNLQTGSVNVIRTQIGKGPQGKIFAADLSPDGKILAVGGWLAGEKREDRDAVRLHSFPNGKIIALLKEHNRVVLSLSFSPTGLLASGDGDGVVIIWDVKEKKKLSDLRIHEMAVYSLSWSPDGNRLAVASFDKTASLWDLSNPKKPKLIARMKHKDLVRSVAFSKDGKYVLTGSRDMKILMWDGETGEFIKVFAKRNSNAPKLVFSPDGKFLLATFGEGWGGLTCHIYSFPEGRIITEFEEHDNTVSAGDISPDGLIATGGGDNKPILIWEKTGRVIKRFEGSGRTVWQVGISYDGSKFGWGNTLRILTSTHKNPIEHIFDIHNLRLIPTPTETQLLRGKTELGNLSLETERGGPYGYEFRLIVKKEGKIIAKIDRDSTNGYCHSSYTFTPDGKYILSAGANGVLEIYDINGKRVSNLVGHTAKVWSVAVSGDGKWAVSGGSDQTVKLWRIEKKKPEIYPTATLFYSKDGEWVLWTEEGYYASSKEGAKYIGWHVNRGIYSLAEFYDASKFFEFYRPDVLAEVFKTGKSVAKVLKELGERAKEVADVLKEYPPLVSIIKPKDEAVIKKKFVSVEVQAVDRGGGVEDITLYLNGKEVKGEMRGIEVRPTGKIHKKIFRISLLPGWNTLKATAYSKSGVEAMGHEIRVKRVGVKVSDFDLYVISVGINKYKNSRYNLDYAKPDAKSFLNVLRSGARKIFKNIYVYEIYDERAVKSEVLKAFGDVAKKADVKDVFVFYYAGHGVVGGKRVRGVPEFFLVLHDVTQIFGREDILREGGISARELRVLLRDIKANKQFVVLDACQAGEVVVAFARRGVAEEKAILQLSHSAGVAVLASSLSEQVAKELEELGHGVFTYLLIEGMKGGADGSPKDGKVTIKELSSYVEGRLPELTERYRGEPQYPTLYIVGQDFPLVTVKSNE